MTDGVRPVGPVIGRDRRAADRRESERRRAAAVLAAGSGRDLVPVGDRTDPGGDHPAVSAARPETPGSAAAFAAQVLGQGGQRTGIRGGPPVLDAARSTYLEAEYSGEKERRPPKGTTRRTEI